MLSELQVVTIRLSGYPYALFQHFVQNNTLKCNSYKYSANRWTQPTLTENKTKLVDEPWCVIHLVLSYLMKVKCNKLLQYINFEFVEQNEQKKKKNWTQISIHENHFQLISNDYKLAANNSYKSVDGKISAEAIFNVIQLTISYYLLTFTD